MAQTQGLQIITPRAPEATALNTSRPLRALPSISTSGVPPTASVIGI